MLSAHSRVVLLGLYGPDRGQWRLTRYDMSVPGEESAGSAGAEGRTTGEEEESGESAGAEATTGEEEARGASQEDTFETKEKTGQNEEMTALTEDKKNVEKKRNTSVNEADGKASSTVEGMAGSPGQTSAGEVDGVTGEDKRTTGVGAESEGTGTCEDTHEGTGAETADPRSESGGAAETGNPGPGTCDDGPKFDGEVARVELVEQGRPSGMTEVVLNGKTCIALSYW